jgi:hypothetical protein
MLKGYEEVDYGLIKQLDPKPFDYGFEYSNNYVKLGVLGLQMAHLRYGFIRGALGDVKIDSVLDVGYGNGDFLKVAAKDISGCFGTDISNEYPVPPDCSFVDRVDSQHYDLITFFDSLEHMHDISFVESLKCSFVCISLPWCHYHSDEWFDTWKHRKPDEHIWHFNDKSLVSYMDAMGFDPLCISNIEDVIRKGVDSFENILTGVFKKR